MEALLYFALWAGIIFLMMRFGCGAHIMGHGHGHGKAQGRHEKTSGQRDEVRWVPPETDQDPVCGKTVHTARAKSTVHDGVVYYFCSRECREVFEANPGLHVGEGAGGKRPKLEHSHA